MESKGKCRTQNVHWTHQTFCSYLGTSPISVHTFMYLCCCQTSATASNSTTQKPRGITMWTILPTTNVLPHLPLGSGILLCRNVCPGPTESMDMVTSTGRVVRAVLSSIHSQKFNTSKTNSPFSGQGPVKRVYLRCFMTAERMCSFIKFVQQRQRFQGMTCWRGREISPEMEFHQLTLGKIWGEFAIEGQLDMRQCRGAITPKTHKLSHCSPGATDG